MIYMSQSVENMDVEDLKPGLRSLFVRVRCGPKEDEREILSRKTGETFRVTEALVGDSTGCILTTLWNDDIDKIETGRLYQLSNVYTTIFKGSLRLSIGKYGTYEEIAEDIIPAINEDNNLSDKVYEQAQPSRPSYGSSPSFRRDSNRPRWKTGYSNKSRSRRY